MELLINWRRHPFAPPLALVAKVSACAIFLFFSLHVSAGGFQANLQGIKQLGMGYTGVGLSQDASSIFINPGGLSFLKHRHNLVIGANLVFPKVTYQEPAPGFYTASTRNTFGTPFLLYGSFRFNEKWTVGIGVNNPFGNALEYDDGWKGQFVIREIDLKTFSFQPTVNYRISDKVGIGAGFSFYLGDILLRRGIPVADTATLQYGEAKLAGSGTG
ncbi:MAG TPA: outer membrane protein transport protein, partial [Chitinophagales bacterium]|nr:outer membrane protein transport protein [Chitinophagales bacterium]